ncbi:hypothetical protein G7Z17_g4294 [Cylindrodendrum hubeiense]|uniref:NmrA-like domain-containing protein n=1 Tax=Cylindrodendrum hubeiense TaxID=595255 RepID=A0A9P5LA17_9HYPO|nr:hypothetical protein G7Z17_g4294 [Cylindrodendrum hubeiense]
MAQKFAKDQPQGFTNKIERVAIVGAGGFVGKILAEALVATGKHTVTAISRAGSTNKLPDGVKVASVDYDDEDSLVAALKGQQFLAITMSVTAPPETQDKIIKAAAKAGVPWVMPNSYGIDHANESLAQESFTGRGVLAGIKSVEDAGFSSWITMCCSFWIEHSIAQLGCYGFDVANKKVTFFDDGNTRINMSTLSLCGKTIVGLLSLKELPEDENDLSPTISQWRNKPIYVSSFLVSQREMLDSLQRVTGTTDKDWTIDHEESKARWERGVKMMQGGERIGFTIAMYTRTFFPNGDGDFQSRNGLDNEVLGLTQEEDIDDASRRVVEMVGYGYNYMSKRY